MEFTIPTTCRLLKVDEAAYALGISPHTLRVWLMLGKIRSIHIGRAVRISEHELTRLIALGSFGANRKGEK